MHFRSYIFIDATIVDSNTKKMILSWMVSVKNQLNYFYDKKSYFNMKVFVRLKNEHQVRFRVISYMVQYTNDLHFRIRTIAEHTR